MSVRALRYLSVALLSLCGLAAQFGGVSGQGTQNPGMQQGGTQPQGFGQPGPSGLWGPGNQARFGPERPPEQGLGAGQDVRGFPSLAGPNGLGSYPLMPGMAPGQKLGSDALVPPVGPRRAPGLWPAWLTAETGDQPAQADRAMLVRSSERVWYRAADETVFVPLPFYDKVRAIGAGAGVQVRTSSGGFEVILHDGATLRAEGRTTIEVRILSDAVAELEVIDVERLWLQATTRLVRLWLPDNTSCEIAGGQLWLRREDARVTVRNYGPGVAKLRSTLGERTVARNQEVAILTEPQPEQSAALALSTRGTIATRPEGRRMRVSGGADGGTVEWLGARVQIAADASVTLDAMAGTTFPDYRSGKPASSPAAEAPASETRR